jgi:four helix bundle protein
MKRFLQITRGSASELEYHLLLTRDLGLLDDEAFANLEENVSGVQRVLAALSQRLKGSGLSGS